jgi:hypothetical protein
VSTRRLTHSGLPWGASRNLGPAADDDVPQIPIMRESLADPGAMLERHARGEPITAGSDVRAQSDTSLDYGGESALATTISNTRDTPLRLDAIV